VAAEGGVPVLFSFKAAGGGGGDEGAGERVGGYFLAIG
jgi:hypothetical protein